MDDARLLAHLLHELRTPVTALRAAASMLQRELARQHVSTRHDYLGDIEAYCDLLQRLVVNAEFLSSTERREIRLHKAPILLWRDVVVPALRHVAPLARERRLPSNQMQSFGFESIPPLYLDRNLMQQVLFNLLGNAIKYALSEPDAFRVEIEAVANSEAFRVHVRDYGHGVPEGFEVEMFEEGSRGPDIWARDVRGSGFGLWVAKRVVEAHGGDLRLSNLKQPTELILALPTSVMNHSG